MSQQRELQIINQWKYSIAKATHEILNNPLITDPDVVSEIAKWKKVVADASKVGALIKPQAEAVQKAVESLEFFLIMDLDFKAKLQRTTFQFAIARELTLSPALLHNLVNLKNVFTPQGEWIIKCYLILNY
jgi:phosphoribosylformylglycinamidine (FGAM) synthase PurS component